MKNYMKIFLQTQRLILRQLTLKDADNLFQLDSDYEVMRFINGGKPTRYETIQQQLLPQWLDYYNKYQGYGYWAAIEKASDEFIGWFHFRPANSSDEIELGYRLRKKVWNQGYATEGSRALISKGFNELGTQRVVAIALPTNKASIRVMEKLGMQFEKKYMHSTHQQEVVKYSFMSGG
jgi:ribosomal-protein-alanine N-acetyltransferase